MGYAVLNYLNDNTIPLGHIIHDIVGIVTGTYTTVGQLPSGATTGLSQIVNSAGRGNWEFVFPATHGTRGTTTNNYVLRAPCISSGSKFKFVRIRGAPASITTNVSNDNLYNIGSSANRGIIMTTATNATSNTALTNESPYNTYSVSSNDYRPFTKTLFYGPFFYISWSSRHLLIISPSWSGVTDYCFTGCFEHTETSISTYRGIAPFITHSFFGSSYSGSGSPSSYGDQGTRYSELSVSNHYNPVTTIATGSLGLGPSTNINSQWDDMTIGATSAASYPTVYTKNSSGSNAMFMQPLFWHQGWIGVPHQFVSSLCDVYRVPAGLGNNGDLLTIGSDTYVYFSLTGNYYGLAVRRA